MFSCISFAAIFDLISDMYIQTFQLEDHSLALVMSVFFRYYHWLIKIHLVFGNLDISFFDFLNFTGSLEIIDTEFYTSSGVRAQQLERQWGAHSFASNTLDVHR